MKALKVVFTKKKSLKVLEYDDVTKITLNQTDNRWDLEFRGGPLVPGGGSGYVYSLDDHICNIIGVVKL